MAFGRMTPGSKLLVRHEYDVAGREFVLANWTITSGVGSIVAGRLRLSNAGSGAVSAVRYAPIAARGEVFLYGVCRATAAESQVGLMAHITDSSLASLDATLVGSTIARAAGELSFLREMVNNVATAASYASAAVAAKAINTPYTFALHVDDVNARGRDATAALDRSFALSAVLNGQVGVWHLDAAPRVTEIDRFIGATIPIVTVLDVPTGGSAEVRTAADAVLASAAEAGGQALIDMFGAALHTAKKVVVLDSTPAVVLTYTATGDEIIEPGETYGVQPASVSGTPGTIGAINIVGPA